MNFYCKAIKFLILIIYQRCEKKNVKNAPGTSYFNKITCNDLKR